MEAPVRHPWPQDSLEDLAQGRLAKARAESPGVAAAAVVDYY